MAVLGGAGKFIIAEVAIPLAVSIVGNGLKSFAKSKSLQAAAKSGARRHGGRYAKGSWGRTSSRGKRRSDNRMDKERGRFSRRSMFPPLQGGEEGCDVLDRGYVCEPELSHNWGPLSPYFELDSDISADVPGDCNVTFVQVVLSTGAHVPTATQIAEYKDTVKRIKGCVKAEALPPKYKFLADYELVLDRDGDGGGELTCFGREQMAKAGTSVFNRYRAFADRYTPFLRISEDVAVLQSALNWTSGYHLARAAAGTCAGAADKCSGAYGVSLISESPGANNTLFHSACPRFGDPTGCAARTGPEAQKTFATTFLPPITARLNGDVPEANLTDAHTLRLMDLCALDTVTTTAGGTTISPLCRLFDAAEWRAYDHHGTLGAYYTDGPGNALGPTQGVGFVNELAARLTGKPVVDATSTNATSLRDPTAFPLGPEHQFFADFTHGPALVSILSALGLFDGAAPLSNTTGTLPKAPSGHDGAQAKAPTATFPSVSRLAPFAARAYIEKMKCGSCPEELVRVIVNGRVVPLPSCGADAQGRCKLSAFIESLAFARKGGEWARCF